VRALKLKSIKYYLVDQILYWKDRLGVLLRFLDPQEAQKIMSKFHDSLCGGHHYWRTTAYKILRDGHKVIIGFLEDIIERFGCPDRIITDNATSFKAEPLI
jgi:hypothetical protein